MSAKSKGSAMVAERTSPVRKPKPIAAIASGDFARPRQTTRELLDEIRVRGDKISAEIKELLVRMG